VDRITVAGHKTLDVLVGLCRRGFLHCTCRAIGGSSCGNETADALWILETQDAAELRTLVAKFGRELDCHGTLIVGFDAHGPADKSARLGEVLTKCGFVAVKEAYARDCGFLICIRKQNETRALAA
jgi:hypothetical protein